MAGRLTDDGPEKTVGLCRTFVVTLVLDIWAACGKTKPNFPGFLLTN
jgi:hypothetical protein